MRARRWLPLVVFHRWGIQDSQCWLLGARAGQAAIPVRVLRCADGSPMDGRSRQRKNDQRRTKTSQKHDPELIYIGRQKNAHWPMSQGVGSAQRNEPHSATADKGEPSTTALLYARACTVWSCGPLRQRLSVPQTASDATYLPKFAPTETLLLLPAKLIL